MGLEPILSYFDRRQTNVVVFIPFENKNATRLQCFPFASYLHSYNHHSNYRWKSPLFAKLELFFFLRFTVPQSILLRETSLLRKPPISDIYPLIGNSFHQD